MGEPDWASVSVSHRAHARKAQEYHKTKRKELLTALYYELTYDAFQFFAMAYLMTQIRMKHDHWEGTVFLDFCNVATTVIDVAIVKGPAGAMAVFSDPTKTGELMLEEMQR